MRPFPRILTAFAAALLSVELLLQGGAYIVSLQHGNAERTGSGGDAAVVLCVGDSFTYGVGSSDSSHAYPAQLEEALRRAGITSAAVVSGGYPGQNSSDVLRGLSSQLEAVRPEVLCVLVGTNDRWRHPIAVAPEDFQGAESATSEGFQWRWRTARLVTWALGAEGTAYEHVEAAKPAKPEPVGGAAPQAAPTVEAPTGQDRGDVARAELGEDGAVDLTVGWDLLKQNRYEAALGFARSAVALAPRNLAFTEQLLAVAATRCGESDLANEAVARLEELTEQDAEDQRAARALLNAYRGIGDRESSVAWAKELIRRFPELPDPHAALIAEYAITQDGEAAEAQFASYLERAASVSDMLKADTHLAAARAWRTGSGERALQHVLSALALGAPGDRCEARMRASCGPIPLQRALEIASSSEIPDAKREAAAQMLVRVFGVRDLSHLKTYEANLLEIVRRGRAAGARVAILTYPASIPEIEEIQTRVARQTGSTFVPARAAFDQLRGERSAAEFFDLYFVADGHCNDDGYAVLGQVAAEAIAGDLQK